MNGKVPLIVPEFKTFIMPAVVRALDEWRSEGEKSECSCACTLGTHSSAVLKFLYELSQLSQPGAHNQHCQHQRQQQKKTGGLSSRKGCYPRRACVCSHHQQHHSMSCCLDFHVWG
jgi:hypothetical protein